MSVRANWNLAGLNDGSDSPVVDIMALAKPIDLSKDVPALNVELARLMQQEANLFDREAVECDLKWQPGNSCYTCPMFEPEAEGSAMNALCRLGRRQEDKLGEIARRRELEELETAAVRQLLADECEELAEFESPCDTPDHQLA